MQYFETYTSNTVAGSGNQFYFSLSPGQTRTGRVFYKITAPGEYPYSLLFSNILDSTYARGELSYKNLICDEWQIHAAKIGRCRGMDPAKPLPQLTMDGSGKADIVVSDLHEITFQGSHSKTVMPGEFFASDPVKMYFGEGDYLCLEMTFSGSMIPYHEESLLPVFVKEGDTWVYSRQMPFAGMIGCGRPAIARIGYVGDSITQGIGAGYNSYLHWNALLSRELGTQYAFWNLGLGYGRANDMASGGAWFYKAVQNDIVFVCYGVNDILQGFSEEQIRSDITRIVRALKQAGKTVILQSIPPFDYKDEKIGIWERLNRYIKEELASEADLFFDNIPLLAQSAEQPHMTKFGDHPNAEGCAVWAAALLEPVRKFLQQVFGGR